ncbi:recombinase family protein [Arthrobacter sp. PvP023]|uniref:recombinase family protein n=1 Tax=Arthrobacter sp. PvP023 TaxID=2806585 RepID=UPI0035A9A68C
MFPSLAEYERSRLSERTRAGLAAAKAMGRLGGRPPAMTRRRNLRQPGTCGVRERNCRRSRRLSA